ncbi:hypothetical protein CYMTET_20180 [Cymbomonas tetramitiformis]|uniref:F-box/LRR-repeat protein 15-like leucin rich repeat domain-containing protein n=1 Tax=Cymbomonas tetramitiformis TaxID=36881 RepID=A0AAE0G579_9CHLO|nr:hypothetical protein CYMTET_20180 [Cymbomonas tetramitiformis]
MENPNFKNARFVQLRHRLPLADSARGANITALPLTVVTSILGQLPLRDVCLAGCVSKFLLQSARATLQEVKELSSSKAFGNTYRLLSLGPSAVRALATCCPNLRSLDIRDCNTITDAAVSAAAKSCPELERVLLSNCKHVTGASITQLSLHCNGVRELVIRHSPGIHERPLLDFVQLRALTRFAMDGCTGVTDCVLATLAQKSGSVLQRLSVSSCVHVTDRSLTAIGRFCPTLRELGVGGCSLITDVGLEAIAEGCQQLELLSMRGCGAVTDASIERIALKCSKLQWLGCRDCTNLTDQSLMQVVVNCTQLWHLAGVCFCDDI